MIALPLNCALSAPALKRPTASVATLTDNCSLGRANNATTSRARHNFAAAGPRLSREARTGDTTATNFRHSRALPRARHGAPRLARWNKGVHGIEPEEGILPARRIIHSPHAAQNPVLEAARQISQVHGSRHAHEPALRL